MSEHVTFRTETQSLMAELDRVSAEMELDVVPPSIRTEPPTTDVSLLDTFRRYRVRSELYREYTTMRDPESIASLKEAVATLNMLDQYLLERLQDNDSSKENQLALRPLQCIQQSMERGRTYPTIGERSDDSLTNVWVAAESLGMTPRSQEFFDLFTSIVDDLPEQVHVLRTRLGLNAYLSDEAYAALRDRTQEIDAIPRPTDGMTLNEMATLLGVDDGTIQRHLGEYAERGISARSRGRMYIYYPHEAFVHVSAHIPRVAGNEYLTVGAIMDEFQQMTGKKPSERIRRVFREFTEEQINDKLRRELESTVAVPLIRKDMRSKFQSASTVHVHRVLADTIKAEIWRQLEALPPVAKPGWETLKGISQLVTSLDPQHRDRRQAINAILATLRTLNPGSLFVQECRPTESIPNAALHYAPHVIDDVLHLMGSKPLPTGEQDLGPYVTKGFRGAFDYFVYKYSGLSDIRQLLTDGGHITIVSDSAGNTILATYETGAGTVADAADNAPPIRFESLSDAETTVQTTTISPHSLDLFIVANSSTLSSSIGRAPLDRLLAQLNIVSMRRLEHMPTASQHPTLPAQNVIRNLAVELPPEVAITHLKEYRDIAQFLSAAQREAVLLLDTTNQGVPIAARFLHRGAGSIGRFMQQFDSYNPLEAMMKQTAGAPIVTRRNREKIVEYGGITTSGYETLVFVRPSLQLNEEHEKITTNSPSLFPIVEQSLLNILEQGCRQSSIPLELARTALANLIKANAGPR